MVDEVGGIWVGVGGCEEDLVVLLGGGVPEDIVTVVFEDALGVVGLAQEV